MSLGSDTDSNPLENLDADQTRKYISELNNKIEDITAEIISIQEDTGDIDEATLEDLQKQKKELQKELEEAKKHFEDLSSGPTESESMMATDKKRSGQTHRMGTNRLVYCKGR